MRLPDGIQQNTACMLIALREMLDDPDWSHPYLLENMRSNRGVGGESRGFDGDVQELARKAGLWCEPMTMMSRCANDDYVVFEINGKRVRFHRSEKVVIVFLTPEGNGHAECVSITFLTSLCRTNMEILNIILPRKGAIIDAF